MLYRTAIAVVLVSLLCFSSAGAASETELTYWHFWGTAEKHKVMQDLAADFTARHPGIKIDVQNMSGDMYDKVMVAIAGGAPPDVVKFERSAVISWVASKGEIFQPLDELLSPELRGEDAFLPMARYEVTFAGKTWATPFDTDVRALISNKGYFEEAGIPSDRRLPDLVELERIAVRLTKRDSEGGLQRVGFAPWLGNWALQGWFWTFGGGLFDDQARKPTIDIPENEEALNWALTYVDKLGPEAVRFAGMWDVTPLIEGRLAMWIGVPSHFFRIQQKAPTLEVGVGEVPWPPGGANGTWSGGYCHVIPSGSKHVPEAASYINYLSSKETQVRLFKTTYDLPTNTEAFWEVMEIVNTPQLLGFLRQLPVSHGRPPLWIDVHTALYEGFYEVLELKKTPPQLLEEIQQYMERQFAEKLGW